MSDQVEKLRVAQLERMKPRHPWLRAWRRGTSVDGASHQGPPGAPVGVFEASVVTFRAEP